MPKASRETHLNRRHHARRKEIKEKLEAGVTDGTEVTYYAMAFKSYEVTYLDERGIIVQIDQDFVKDNTVTVKQHLNNVAKALGAEAEIVGFERFVMGEGLEKKNEDFAAEIAKITNK